MKPTVVQKTQISQSKHSQSSRFSLNGLGFLISATGVAALTHYFHQLKFPSLQPHQLTNSTAQDPSVLTVAQPRDRRQCLAMPCTDSTDPFGHFENTLFCRDAATGDGLHFPLSVVSDARHCVLAGNFMGVPKNLGAIAGLSFFNVYQSPASVGAYILGTFKSVHDATQSKTSDFEFPEMKAEAQSGSGHLSTIFPEIVFLSASIVSELLKEHKNPDSSFNIPTQFVNSIWLSSDILMAYQTWQTSHTGTTERAHQLLNGLENTATGVAISTAVMLLYQFTTSHIEKLLFIAKLSSGDASLENASEALKNDKEVVLAAVRRNGLALNYASEALQNDKEVVLAAVRKHGLALYHASEALKNDKEVVLAALAQNGHLLMQASKLLKANKEVVLAAVRKNGCALEYASEALQDDEEVVLAAVAQNGCALEYASEALQDDEGVVCAARSQKNYALQWASDRLWTKLRQAS